METRTELENKITAVSTSSDFREVKMKRKVENLRAEMSTDRSTVREGARVTEHIAYRAGS